MDSQVVLVVSSNSSIDCLPENLLRTAPDVAMAKLDFGKLASVRMVLTISTIPNKMFQNLSLL